MRPWMSLALVLALCAVPAAAVAAGSPDASDDSATQSAVRPTRDAPLSLIMLWPGTLALGYISISLKEQLRRRGHSAAPRGRTFDDLIALPGPAPAVPSPDAERPPTEHKAL